MHNQSTRFCKSCRRDLPLCAFDHKMVSYPRSDIRYGSGLRKQGLRPQCRECRAIESAKRIAAESVNPSGLCQCGCGLPVNPPERPTRPHRFLPGHQSRKSPVPYVVDEKTGCWIWQRATDGHGYGMTHRDGKAIGAHRALYIEHKGTVSVGMVMDHLCRNPLCVNPDHLEPVTSRENYLRGIRGKLTPELVREIRFLAGTIPRKQIAARFGISVPYVCRIINRRAWSDVD
jgi:hypothetical protein